MNALFQPRPGKRPAAREQTMRALLAVRPWEGSVTPSGSR